MVSEFGLLASHRIRKLREERGLTQARLADALNRSTLSISNIERGISEVSFATAQAIAEHFDIEVQELLFDVPSMNKDERDLENLKALIRDLCEGDRKIIRGLVDRLRSGKAK
jgi:transcriptional regulator with XRE-family HTH domain